MASKPRRMATLAILVLTGPKNKIMLRPVNTRGCWSLTSDISIAMLSHGMSCVYGFTSTQAMGEHLLRNRLLRPYPIERSHQKVRGEFPMWRKNKVIFPPWEFPDWWDLHIQRGPWRWLVSPATAVGWTATPLLWFTPSRVPWPTHCRQQDSGSNE